MEKTRRGPQYKALNQDPAAVQRMLSLTRMTKTQLHQRTNISLSLISEIMSGTRNATPEKLGRIADAFNCPVTMLEAKRNGPEVAA